RRAGQRVLCSGAVHSGRRSRDHDRTDPAHRGADHGDRRRDRERGGMTEGPAAVIVTGLGAVSALGTGCEAHLAALLSGSHGIRPVTRFDTTRLGCSLGATWPAWDGRVQPEPGSELRLRDTALGFPLHEMALAAARE